MLWVSKAGHYRHVLLHIRQADNGIRNPTQRALNSKPSRYNEMIFSKLRIWHLRTIIDGVHHIFSYYFLLFHVLYLLRWLQTLRYICRLILLVKEYPWCTCNGHFNTFLRITSGKYQWQRGTRVVTKHSYQPSFAHVWQWKRDGVIEKFLMKAQKWYFFVTFMIVDASSNHKPFKRLERCCKQITFFTVNEKFVILKRVSCWLPRNKFSPTEKLDGYAIITW